MICRILGMLDVFILIYSTIGKCRKKFNSKQSQIPAQEIMGGSQATKFKGIFCDKTQQHKP